MSVTINSSSTPSITVFQQDLAELVEFLKRNSYPNQNMSPGTLTLLASICNSANGTTSIVLS